MDTSCTAYPYSDKNHNCVYFQNELCGDVQWESRKHLLVSITAKIHTT